MNVLGTDTFSKYRSLTSQAVNYRARLNEYMGRTVHRGYDIEFIEETRYISNYNMEETLTII